MQSPITIAIGLILMTILVAVVWRLFSNRRSIPCPSWLGWMVEKDKQAKSSRPLSYVKLIRL
jgi:hypothetical protein